MAKSNLERMVDDTVIPAIHKVEQEFGMIAIDHLIKVLEERRKTLIYEGEAERRGMR
jgi:Mg/Co/Ni transporter MgtE